MAVGNRAPDYSLTLGQIAKTQAAIGARLETMEGHPALRLTPAAFGENRAGGGGGHAQGLV
jgi:hypothetical protein